MSNYVSALEFGPSGELLAGDNGHLVEFTNLDQPEPTVRDLTSALTVPPGLEPISPPMARPSPSARATLLVSTMRTALLPSDRR